MSIKDNTAVVDTSTSPHAKLRSLQFDAVKLQDGYWNYWQKVNRSHALAYGYQQLTNTQILANFEIAAGRRDGEFQNMLFADSDLYKWLEGAAYELAPPGLSGAAGQIVEAGSPRPCTGMMLSREPGTSTTAVDLCGNRESG